MQGFNASGDHLSTDGISPSGQLVTVPLYKHEVSLDFSRLEATLEYGLAENWDLRLRIPYDIKKRKSSIATIAPANVGEIDAMQRDADYHHAEKTLRGFSDLHLLATRYFPNALLEGDSASLSFGMSLPVGKIEENPYILGDAGMPHEHIQFGTGTFDPLLEFSYSVPLAANLRGGIFGNARFPLYENRKDYQGSKEATAGLQLSYMFAPAWSAHGSVLFSHQAFAHWNGARDLNTGANRSSALFGVGYRWVNGLYTSIDYLSPIAEDTLASGGDNYEQGRIFLLSTSFSF